MGRPRETLHLASNLALPLDASTQTFLIVGKRGSGKSSTATRFGEELIRAHVPIAVLDPVDVWWGLKAGRDGKSTGGLGVYVFGGKHADLPLEATAGALMADVLVDHRVSAVFVLRTFSNREKARFVSDFAEQLFKRNQDVLHVFAEEAHELMPQQWGAHTTWPFHAFGGWYHGQRLYVGAVDQAFVFALERAREIVLTATLPPTPFAFAFANAVAMNFTPA